MAYLIRYERVEKAERVGQILGQFAEMTARPFDDEQNQQALIVDFIIDLMHRQHLDENGTSVEDIVQFAGIEFKKEIGQ